MKHDWVRTGTIVSVLILLIAIVSYVWPPDPAHPMSFGLLTKAIVLPPWLGLAIVLALIVVTSKVASLITAPKQRQTIPELDRLFELHATSVEQSRTPAPDIKYPSKLRLSLENTSGKQVRVLPMHWVTTIGKLSVQCGAAPYPNVPYEPGMQEFSYQYQLEEFPGSWKDDKWNSTENRELSVDPTRTFRIWIGMNPCIPPHILESRRKTRNLGTLILPVVIGGQQFDWKLGL